MTAPQTFKEEYRWQRGLMATFSLWKDEGISTEIKIQLLQMCVLQVLLYVAETWDHEERWSA